MGPSLRSHGRRIATVLLVIALLLPLATGIGAAQSFEGASGTIVVEEGETVDDIQGVAGSIVVRGTVTGDLSGTAGTIRIAETGQVDGSLSGAAGTVIVDGTVGGDVQVGAGSFDLSDTGRIGGSLDVGSGSINLDGAVGGDVRAAGETVVLGPNADVGGEFRYDAETFTESPDASVAGGVVEDTSLRGETGFAFGTDLAPSWFGSVYGLLANLVLGGLLLLAFPRFSGDVSDRVGDDPLVSGGTGLLALIGVPVLIALVAITVVGIPLSLVGIAGYVVALWVGSVYGKYAIGAWVLGRAGSRNRWAALLLGLVGIALLGLIPVLGGLIELVALLVGLGALGLGLRDRYRGRNGSVVPPSRSVDVD